MKNYVIGHRNKATGETGQGVIPLTKAEAEQTARNLNQQIPGMEHFIERLEDK